MGSEPRIPQPPSIWSLLPLWRSNAVSTRGRSAPAAPQLLTEAPASSSRQWPGQRPAGRKRSPTTSESWQSAAAAACKAASTQEPGHDAQAAAGWPPSAECDSAGGHAAPAAGAGPWPEPRGARPADARNPQGLPGRRAVPRLRPQSQPARYSTRLRKQESKHLQLHRPQSQPLANLSQAVSLKRAAKPPSDSVALRRPGLGALQLNTHFSR